MRTLYADKGITTMQVGVTIGLVLLLSFIVVFLVRYKDAHWLPSAFERSVQKIQIIQTMSHDLLSAAEAEKSAVMADTDEASQALAEQSLQASQHVEKARRELEPLLEGIVRKRICFESLASAGTSSRRLTARCSPWPYKTPTSRRSGYPLCLPLKP